MTYIPADPAALAADFEVSGSRWSADGEQHRVKRDSNLRQEAAKDASVYAVVKQDAIVNVIGEDVEWWHVEFVGWMAKSQIGPSIDPPAK